MNLKNIIKNKSMTELKDVSELLKAMEGCEQMKGMSVLEHGKNVAKKFALIVGGAWSGMRVPDWLRDYFPKIKDSIYPVASVGMIYAVYHDCGKPFCVEEDKDGRRHFPNHAKVSEKKYLEYHPFSDSRVSDLIRDDMDIHVLKVDEFKEKLMCWSRGHAFTLLLMALAEVHANAEMFGGIESDSFKMKWKRVNSRGKIICEFFGFKKS